MKLSKPNDSKLITWDLLRDLDQQMYLAKRSKVLGNQPHVAVPTEVLEELITRWRVLEACPDGAFPVFYAGPGKHPDHPEVNCFTCGHKPNCATHESVGYIDGPCNCEKLGNSDG